MGLFVISTIIFVGIIILIIYQGNIMWYTFLSATLTGITSLVAGLLLILDDPDDIFLSWLEDRDQIEAELSKFDELTKYEKFDLLNDIKDNNDELMTRIKYTEGWFLGAYYADEYIYFEPIEEPKFSFGKAEKKK